MNVLVILAVLSLTTLAYALAVVLRHDPRRPDQAPPRSHRHEAPPQPWYAAEPRHRSDGWAA